MPLPRHRRTVPPTGASAVVPRAPGALFALVVALLGVLGALVAAAGPAAAAGPCSGPLAIGQIRVVMVVDPGDTGPRAPMATCLVVAAGTSGSKILAQRASELGLPSPRYAGSGLLCGLDGFPATACPVDNGGSYAYWAYFNGVGGNWSFGHDNPFVRRMVDGEIMGWRYTTGSSDGGAPAPRVAPSGSLFPPLTPAPTAPVPAPDPAPGPPADGSTGGVPGGNGGAATAADPSAPAGVDPTAVTGSTDATGVATDSTASTTTGADGATDASAQAEELAAAPASSSSAAGRWVGIAVAVAAVGALTFGAVSRTRSRRA